MVDDGRLAIIQGVGYPNPDRSHFRSMAIWQTARLDQQGPEVHGWLGRGLDGAGATGGPAAVFVGDRDVAARPAWPPDRDRIVCRSRRPFAGHCRRRHAVPDPSAADDLTAFVNRTVTGAYTTAEELSAAARRKSESAIRYPDSELGQHLELVARSIKAGSAARVYYTIQSGYDTHAVQLPDSRPVTRRFLPGHPRIPG